MFLAFPFLQSFLLLPGFLLRLCLLIRLFLVPFSFAFCVAAASPLFLLPLFLLLRRCFFCFFSYFTAGDFPIPVSDLFQETQAEMAAAAAAATAARERERTKVSSLLSRLLSCCCQALGQQEYGIQNTVLLLKEARHSRKSKSQKQSVALKEEYI